MNFIEEKQRKNGRIEAASREIERERGGERESERAEKRDRSTSEKNTWRCAFLLILFPLFILCLHQFFSIYLFLLRCPSFFYLYGTISICHFPFQARPSLPFSRSDKIVGTKSLVQISIYHAFYKWSGIDIFHHCTLICLLHGFQLGPNSENV